ncbi:MAG TPA: phosphoribosylformylglycinamidine synthase subunit PurL [Alphaproteobacteria bacterium]|nr:phosphoribosylformylglycinamidine synthase subunit PurL [Alphaproteobacteria bacterium]
MRPGTLEAAKQFGLNEAEWANILRLLNRTPNMTELGIFSVMWSEHCSYKSSRVHLRTLPTSAPWVIQGPGENAGVIDIGDGDAIVFKMESHNHPSFIEPFQGAATGVGGIMRDVFTMGARPIAMLNALRFGEPEHPKTRHLLAGVVSGIGSYGNCMGVPTVGGEVNFHKAYNGNILVNAMCVGLARADNIWLSAAKGAGNPVVYVGSKTGRDGIHGATMASAEFSEDAEEKRPTVQVGDPFTEKLLLEACLELMATDAIIGIQDMGAAGLTSASCEMAAKGGAGIELWMDKVPQREAGMTAYEMMLSESQERMLMVLKPGREAEAERIFRKWELDFAVIGITTDTKRIVLRHHGEDVCDLPVNVLADEAPVYERPWVEPPRPAPLSDVPAPPSILGVLKQLVASPDLASRRWIWEQYDYSVMADTIQKPGGDAAVVRVHGTGKAVALTTDVTPRYCQADPYLGGMQAIAEAYRNLSAVGAKPLAVTDNLNFGNPQKPEIMGQFALAVRGLGEACRALDFPIVSGNVSLYNETLLPNGQYQNILPTPAIGGVGLLRDWRHMATIAFKAEGEAVILIGETKGHLGQSLYLREILQREDGTPPLVDLGSEKRNGIFVRTLIEAGQVTTAHDCADGGLLVAIAEMAMAGGIGAELAAPVNGDPHAYWFGEDQARYVICVPQSTAHDILAQADAAAVPAARIGTTGGEMIILDETNISIRALKDPHEAWLPDLMRR